MWNCLTKIEKLRKIAVIEKQIAIIEFKAQKE